MNSSRWLPISLAALALAGCVGSIPAPRPDAAIELIPASTPMPATTAVIDAPPATALHETATPAATPTPDPTPVPSPPPAAVSAQEVGCPGVILDEFGELAGEACRISYCESRWFPGVTGDSGRSLGLFQLWTGWATWYGVPPDALYDPATNARVARAVREHRGRWGGAGGWTCADLLGIR